MYNDLKIKIPPTFIFFRPLKPVAMLAISDDRLFVTFTAKSIRSFMVRADMFFGVLDS